MDTCLFDSAASALFYLKMGNTASKVHDQALRSLKKDNNQERISFLTEVIRKYEKKLGKTLVEYGRWQLNPLKDRSASPTICVLAGTDGLCSHAVAIVGGWIFDSNEEEALPLCIESLHQCAPPAYAGVAYAIRYML
jgi:hypothetical protein